MLFNSSRCRRQCLNTLMWFQVFKKILLKITHIFLTIFYNLFCRLVTSPELSQCSNNIFCSFLKTANQELLLSFSRSPVVSHPDNRALQEELQHDSCLKHHIYILKLNIMLCSSRARNNNSFRTQYVEHIQGEDKYICIWRPNVHI